MPKERKQFGSSLQFILSCVGYAIWRFPTLAYENGGGSFIIPYICCSFLIGFPLLYLELSLGQYSQSGPATAYGKIRPYAQGIGWGMSLMSTMVSIYYNVIVAWTLVFIVSILRGQTEKWATCENAWNDINCTSALENQACSLKFKDSAAFFFNHSCHAGEDFEALRPLMLNNQSATTQFFETYILQKTNSMEDFGGMNWPVFAALVIVWIMTALALSKGVHLIGKLSYITATVPYVIIAILFVRSVTLEGAKLGLDFYLLNIDTGPIFKFETWHRAATQVCYSLAIGFGGLLSLSSYNPRTHNCFRDALIIVSADSFMSIFGGTAVFSVLGFMATKQKKNIHEVVTSDVGLAFIAYPEAMNQMSFAPWLWSLLFFTMLFILGISSQFGLAEVLISAINDQFPSTRRCPLLVVSSVCFCLLLGGVVMTTKSGIFYFQIFNDYSASFALCIHIILELILICYIYGIKNWVSDLQKMCGTSSTWFGKIFGRSGYYFRVVWCVIAPVSIGVLLVTMIIDQKDAVPKYGKGNNVYVLPDWSIHLGWIISTLPLIATPIMLIANIIHFRAIKKPLKELASAREDWAATTEPKSSTSSSSLDETSPLPTTSTTNLYKIRPIEISPSDAWSSGTVTARPGKSH